MTIEKTMAPVATRAVHPHLLSRKRAKQAGLSLIETLLVLGVIALVLIGAYQGYKSATGDIKGSDMTKSAVALSSAVSRLYSAGADYTGLTNTVVTSARVVPASLKVNGTTITNAWNGAVTVEPGTGTTGGTIAAADGGTITNFKLVYAGVSSDDCANFAASIANNALAVFVGGVAPATNGVKVIGGAFSPALAATACSGATAKTVIVLNN